MDLLRLRLRPRPLWIVAAGLLFNGCSKPPTGIPTTGLLYLDDMPLSGATVFYYPTEGTEGQGGGAATDSEGKFVVQGAQGPGLLEGNYRIVVSRRLNADGTPADPNVPPIESNARETLPVTYTQLDSTPLKAPVVKNQQPHQLWLKSK